ncbi:alpha-amylase/4-alpha-glucanotransferase domain-containing protein [Sulfurovum sp.]|uniref:alpha-amylase/4-alpha-glucanotransferase domain-containing protein n=1 Tax=Sulfurovum sp. TaxID=1969726 RepID=UPI00286825D8|nr:alpha-amylase/4-alpha-glucanotransferase domain-containing protein [Sulfurovum sp.]
MDNTTKLLFGIHMHQPIDNFDWVIKHGVEVCYGPFFEVMSQYPEFRFSVHCSGWLMEQIEQFHPKLFQQIMTLAKKGSIEFFSAGYYEPILSVIPSRDRVTQINMLNDSIQSNFNQRPKGLWLTERVWESSIVPDLSRAGMKYTVMDDYHFQCAGFDEDILDGYYMSEEGGDEIGLFPISKKLRYAIPFLNVDSVIKMIKSFNRKEDSAAIIFDDAEKFGMWPGTHEWVYEKGWLESFVQAVLADEMIETMHYGEYYQQEHTRGIAYLPNVSYYEMGEWSLRADDTLRLESLKQEMGHDRYEKEGVKFLKGGIWKNFFVKYEESNRIHKRMLELSKARTSVASSDFDSALYKAQTNDALWHGIFGGLYLPNLRDNTYRYLIEGENVRYTKKSVLVSDQNELDGYDKVKAITPKYIFRFDGAQGGQMVEFDSRKACFNWQNTLTRRKEAYHQRLFEDQSTTKTAAAEEGIDTIHHAAMEVDDTLRDAIIYDWYLKNSFVDHISDECFNTDTFRHCNFREYGDFANQPFEVLLKKKKVTFSRDGGLYFPEKMQAYLKKSYMPKNSGFDFEIKLSTEATGCFNYVLEHNFHFADYGAITVNGESLSEDGRVEHASALEIYDGYLKQKIIIMLDQPCSIYYFQLKTLSQSENGFDLSVQGVSFAMLIPFSKALLIEGSLEVHCV